MTKFYDTLRVFDYENDNVENRKQPISIQGLVEMAKEVSDKMIINKIKVFYFYLDIKNHNNNNHLNGLLKLIEE